MTIPSILDIQDSIVSQVVSSTTIPWRHALIDIEIGIVDGEQCENCLMLLFSKAGNAWVSHSASLPYACYDKFVELRVQMAKTGGTATWSICTLKIDSNGKYRYSFSYESPRRLAGRHDKESMFEDYEPQSL